MVWIEHIAAAQKYPLLPFEDLIRACYPHGKALGPIPRALWLRRPSALRMAALSDEMLKKSLMQLEIYSQNIYFSFRDPHY